MTVLRPQEFHQLNLRFSISCEFMAENQLHTEIATIILMLAEKVQLPSRMFSGILKCKIKFKSSCMSIWWL